MGYEVIEVGHKIIKAWIQGVPVETKALEQLKNLAALPFIYKWAAAMPDIHWGIGATVGTVLPTRGAVIPAAVGVDIGCGMMALHTSLKQSDLPSDLKAVRQAIEAAVPMGRGSNKDPNAIGAWKEIPEHVQTVWDAELKDAFTALCIALPHLKDKNHINHLGTLGTGNHFIEVCLDAEDGVWFLLHSGSRGIGNQIGQTFIQRAKEHMERWFISLPDKDLAYLPEGTDDFALYMRAVTWAQKFALLNRELMMEAVIQAAQRTFPAFTTKQVINSHHNYVARENHFKENILVTRKGAVRARLGDWGIIPGSMGTRSYIVRGKGCADSFMSCSHGAGRAMGRREAERTFTIEDHIRATQGVECLKDASVLDETPGAYKPIDAVMAAQVDLVEPVHVLKQIICAKGISA